MEINADVNEEDIITCPEFSQPALRAHNDKIKQLLFAKTALAQKNHKISYNLYFNPPA